MTVVDVFKANDIVTQLKDVLDGFESENERAEHCETVAQTLDIVQNNYYLVPKQLVKDDKLININEPENTLQVIISELWAEV